MNKKELAAILQTDDGTDAASRVIADLLAEPMSKVAAALCTMMVARCLAVNGRLDFDWMRREAPHIVASFSGESLLPLVLKGFDNGADKITQFTEELK